MVATRSQADLKVRLYDPGLQRRPWLSSAGCVEADLSAAAKASADPP